MIYTLYFTFISVIIRPFPLFLHVARDELAECTDQWGRDKVTASKHQNDRNTKKDDKVFEVVKKGHKNKLQREISHQRIVFLENKLHDI